MISRLWGAPSGLALKVNCSARGVMKPSRCWAVLGMHTAAEV